MTVCPGEREVSPTKPHGPRHNIQEREGQGSGVAVKYASIVAVAIVAVVAVGTAVTVVAAANIVPQKRDHQPHPCCASVPKVQAPANHKSSRLREKNLSAQP